MSGVGMVHREDIVKYPGTLADLAVDVGNLRYDALARFLRSLSNKLAEDGSADASRGRPLLAVQLHDAAAALAAGTASINRAWAIAAPHMGGVAESPTPDP